MTLLLSRDISKGNISNNKKSNGKKLITGLAGLTTGSELRKSDLTPDGAKILRLCTEALSSLNGELTRGIKVSIDQKEVEVKNLFFVPRPTAASNSGKLRSDVLRLDFTGGVYSAKLAAAIFSKRSDIFALQMKVKGNWKPWVLVFASQTDKEAFISAKTDETETAVIPEAVNLIGKSELKTLLQSIREKLPTAKVKAIIKTDERTNPPTVLLKLYDFSDKAAHQTALGIVKDGGFIAYKRKSPVKTNTPGIYVHGGQPLPLEVIYTGQTSVVNESGGGNLIKKITDLVFPAFIKRLVDFLKREEIVILTGNISRDDVTTIVNLLGAKEVTPDEFVRILKKEME